MQGHTEVRLANRGTDDPSARPKIRLVVEWPEDDAEPKKYAFVKLPDHISKKTLVRIFKERWRTERVYQDLKDELGLDHFEGRRFSGWHHHVSVALACFAFTVAERARLFPPAAEPKAQSKAFESAA